MLSNVEKEGFTIIELMVVVSIIGILAAIAITNLIGYRDKAFCSNVELDAGNILSSLSCYFSDATNRTCSSLDSLRNDDTCGFEIQEINTANLQLFGSGNRNYWVIQVTDGGQRCPRGSYFTTYMGTQAAPHWSD